MNTRPARLLILTLFLASSCIASLAQTGDNSLAGTVLDSAGNKPLAGASVFLNSTSRGTITREDGSFLLKGIPRGKYQMVVSAIGYETYVLELDGNRLP